MVPPELVKETLLNLKAICH